jgi:hypothetical protein
MCNSPKKNKKKSSISSYVLDKRLARYKHIFIKQKRLATALNKMYWLLRRKPKLSTSNKLLLCKAILKPICTYRIQLWCKASTSNMDILERFQSKTSRMMVDATWYMPNTVIRRDLRIPTVKEEIGRYSSQYSACLGAHPKGLVVNLMEPHLPKDLPTRFLVWLSYL